MPKKKQLSAAKKLNAVPLNENEAISTKGAAASIHYALRSRETDQNVDSSSFTKAVSGTETVGTGSSALNLNCGMVGGSAKDSCLIGVSKSLEYNENKNNVVEVLDSGNSNNAAVISLSAGTNSKPIELSATVSGLKNVAPVGVDGLKPDGYPCNQEASAIGVSFLINTGQIPNNLAVEGRVSNSDKHLGLQDLLADEATLLETD